MIENIELNHAFFKKHFLGSGSDTVANIKTGPLDMEVKENGHINGLCRKSVNLISRKIKNFLSLDIKNIYFESVGKEKKIEIGFQFQISNMDGLWIRRITFL